MDPQPLRPALTAEEYLWGEQESLVRHEFIDGQVYAMVGASDRHGLVALNIAAALSQRLPDRCQVFVSDMKLRIQTAEREVFYYPDVLVSCDPRDREAYYRRHPCLVIEVLSPHTARIDRFEKPPVYHQIESLMEYVLVYQDFRLVEVFRRSQQWRATEYTQGELRFESVDLAVAIDDIYRRTDR